MRIIESSTDKIVNKTFDMSVESLAHIIALIEELNRLGIKVNIQQIRKRVEEATKEIREKVINDLKE